MQSRPGPGTARRPAVVLVTMPFAGFRQPSLALGLLKSSLSHLPVDVMVLDATLMYAALVGAETYDQIATWRAEDLLGDWVFSAALRPAGAEADAAYEADVLTGGLPQHDLPYFGKPPLDDTLRGRLRSARERAPEILETCLREVLARKPLVVGFTSMFQQHTASLALARRIKAALPSTVIVFGGASCRGQMGLELLRSFAFVDAVVPGEGEEVLPELVRRRLAGQPLSGLPGLLTAADLAAGGAVDGERPGGGGAAEAAPAPPPPVDLDRLPRPDFSDYFARLAGGPLHGSFTPRLPVETSRGCWWGQRSRCIFCGQASRTLEYRHKSADRVLSELDELARRHGDLPVLLTDEVFPPRLFADLLPALPTRLPGLEVVYCQVRPTVGKEQLRLLANAGVRRLEVGIESFSTPVLELMRKGTTSLHGVQLLKWARELGIDAVWNLLWGLPGEDPEEYERMAALVPLLAHLQPPHTVGAFRLDRFSPVFEAPDAYGIGDVRPYPAYRYVYDLPEGALTRLAYFFVFRSRRPQTVEAYTRRLAGQVDAWKRAWPAATLTFQDDGRRLVLDDRRPAADPDELTVLDGEHRTLYLACDEVRRLPHLRRRLEETLGAPVETDHVRAALDALVQEGLMLREDDAYLSLAVPTPA